MTKNETRWIYFRESWWQSVVADCFMFLALSGAMAMNYHYFGNSWFWGLILFGMVLMAATARARSQTYTFYSVEDLKKHVSGL